MISAESYRQMQQIQILKIFESALYMKSVSMSFSTTVSMQKSKWRGYILRPREKNVMLTSATDHQKKKKKGKEKYSWVKRGG